MMMLKKRAALILSVAVAVVVLVGCTASEAPPLETGAGYEPPAPEPEVDAATIDPCADQFAFQRELNGVPDATATEADTAQGKSLARELYWYADSSMIVYFSYAEGETWCNVWNESGVNWNY